MSGKLGRHRKGVIPLQTPPVKTLYCKWKTYCDVCFEDIEVGQKFRWNMNDKTRKHMNCK